MDAIAAWRKARWPLSSSFAYLLRDPRFLEVSAKGNTAFMDYIDYWKMFGKVAELKDSEITSLMMMSPKNAEFSKQVLEQAKDPAAVTLQDIKNAGKRIEAVAALDSLFKPAAAGGVTPIAAAPQQVEEKKEYSLEDMVNEKVAAALALERSRSGSDGGGNRSRGRAWQSGGGNRRGGMYGGRPTKPASAYFHQYTKVISPACRECGMAPHGGRCQVVHCDFECFYCHNKGHRFTCV